MTTWLCGLSLRGVETFDRRSTREKMTILMMGKSPPEEKLLGIIEGSIVPEILKNQTTY